MDSGLENLLLLTDSYKVSHYKQYPPGTSQIYSYFESRGGKFPYTLFFGLQYILKRHLVGTVVTEERIAEAREVSSKHFNNPDLFNEEGWRYILEHHNGRLPIRIRAVPEGLPIQTHNVLMTIENTDPKCFWLTNYLETLLVQVWYPCTVATSSRIQKELIATYLSETSDSMNSLPLELRDFGFRGSTSVESSAIGGLAHLINFRGTSTMSALLCGRKYYNCDMAGVSIPSSEHSTIASWGRENELEAYSHYLKQFPTGPISCVSDTFDVYRVCSEVWGKELKGEVENRNGVLYVRPDSGEPVMVVLRVLEILGEKFGTTLNSKGYKMLPRYLRVIQGDSINLDSLKRILAALKQEGWSAENLAYGSGGALLQSVDRDTQKCAFKCSYAVVNGEGRNVYKDPVTDHGKVSKRGRLALICENGQYKTVEENQADSTINDVLVTVFENGSLTRDYTLDEIRANAEIDMLCKYGNGTSSQPVPSAPTPGFLSSEPSFKSVSTILSNATQSSSYRSSPLSLTPEIINLSIGPSKPHTVTFSPILSTNGSANGSSPAQMNRPVSGSTGKAILNGPIAAQYTNGDIHSKSH